jgi:membrane-anchored protein YejM (alkaline phosphatase superfamily)
MKQALGCTNSYDDYSIGKDLFDERKLSWLVVGSYDNFAIIDTAKITSVYYDGSFDVTDLNLNLLEQQTFDSKIYDQIFRQINKFNQ